MTTNLTRAAPCLLWNFLWIVAMMCCPTQGHAGVTPDYSRVIVPAETGEQSLQLFNVNSYPVLVQAWVDDGNIEALPQESQAPIVTLPPIFRMSEGGQQSLRLVQGENDLPRDRESLFWLNLYEIPETPTHSPPDEQAVVVTMHTQYKVFVRPSTLPFPAQELPGRLQLSAKSADGRVTLTIDNTTPYFATISGVEMRHKETAETGNVDMIDPFSSGHVSFETIGAAPGDSVDVTFALLDDDGNPQIGTRNLTIPK